MRISLFTVAALEDTVSPGGCFFYPFPMASVNFKPSWSTVVAGGYFNVRCFLFLFCFCFCCFVLFCVLFCFFVLFCFYVIPWPQIQGEEIVDGASTCISSGGKTFETGKMRAAHNISQRKSLTRRHLVQARFLIDKDLQSANCISQLPKLNFNILHIPLERA